MLLDSEADNACGPAVRHSGGHQYLPRSREAGDARGEIHRETPYTRRRIVTLRPRPLTHLA